MSKLRVVSLFVLFAMLLAAFAPVSSAAAAPAAAGGQNIVDIAAGDSRFKTLVAAVQAAGLVETLQGAGPFTVFAPTDQAFAKLPKGTVEALLKDPAALKNILTYHVAAGNLMAADVLKLSSVDTVQGSPALIQLKGGNAYINNARIIITDIVASNGVIHVIDSVILPPSKDIVDTAAGDGRFKTLVAAVQAAGLVDTLKAKGPYTVFAPTDQAFAKLPKGTVEALLKDPEALKGILTYHVLGSRAFAADAMKLTSADTVQGSPIVIKKQGNNLFINNARVVITDILTTNGVIHVIDTVLLPPSKDIVDTAVADGRFKTLVAAVEAAGLVETLKGKGPYTVFAPTDQAFAKLPKGTVEALLKDPEALKGILTYHVLGSRAFAADAEMLVSADTVQGAPILIKKQGNSLLINNARVVISDILTTNGVIHVIDTVLLPPSKDIVDTAVADGRFKTLVAAVQAAGLVDTLKAKGPYTVFAPTDQAFAKLPKGTVEALLKDPEALKGILTYHVLGSRAFAGDVVKLTSAQTVQGAPVVVKLQGNNVFVNNARVVITDILTTNGVIHVIDTVLLPPSKDIVDTAVADGRFKTLVAAVEAAGLVETLKGKGPFTVFAPTDQAFAKLPKGTVEALLKDPAALKNILTYHVVAGQVFAGDVVKLTSADTVQGKPVTISVKAGKVYINDAQVIITDILTTNGVIHVIDRVILPPQ